MKITRARIAACAAVAFALWTGGAPVLSLPGMQPKRYAAVIGLKPERVAEYTRLHAAVWPDILVKLRAANIRNYSIYLREIERGSSISSRTTSMSAGISRPIWPVSRRSRLKNGGSSRSLPDAGSPPRRRRVLGGHKEVFIWIGERRSELRMERIARIDRLTRWRNLDILDYRM